MDPVLRNALAALPIHSEPAVLRKQVLLFGALCAWMMELDDECQAPHRVLAEELLGRAEVRGALSALDPADRDSFEMWLCSVEDVSVAGALEAAKQFRGNRAELYNQLGAVLFNEVESGENGIVLTPTWLASVVIDKALAYWHMLHPHERTPRLIGDLSCGAGVFLGDICGRVPDAAVIGVEVAPWLAGLARLANSNHSNCRIEVADTLLNVKRQPLLFASEEPGLPIDYDIIVGNPPYVRSQNLSANYVARLKMHYPTLAVGNFDLVILFMANALEALRAGGVAALLVSHKFMTSSYGSRIARIMAQKSHVLEIVNFGDGQVFPGRTTYSSLLIFAKKEPGPTLRVVDFPPGLRWSEENQHFGKGQTYELPSKVLHSHPWNLSGGVKRRITEQFRTERTVGIMDVFSNISQGIRTGANTVFVLDAEKYENLEPGLLVPLIGGRNVTRGKVGPTDSFLLWPYQVTEQGRAEVIREDVLSAAFPMTWEYLLSHKNSLGARSLESGLPWYAYSRSQNLTVHMQPKIFFKEMMPRAEVAADLTGEYAFSSGYALIGSPLMPESDLRFWTAIFNTPTMEFQFRLLGTQLHSGWFRLLKHHLRSIRLPALASSEKREAEEIVDELWGNSFTDASLGKLDDIVADAFGLTPEMRSEVAETLERAHEVSRPASAEEPSTHLRASKHITAFPELTEMQRRRFMPVELAEYNDWHVDRLDLGRLVTYEANKRNPRHRWYKFTQGFSGDLVQTLIKEMAITTGDRVYDPFAGVGTTLLTCRLNGIASYGRDVSPLAVWISRLKVREWDLKELRDAVIAVEQASPGVAEDQALLFLDYWRKAYSKQIVQQILAWRNWIERLDYPREVREFMLLALVCLLEDVSQIRKHGSHYRFLNKTTSVGLEKLNIETIPDDASIKPLLIRQLEEMVTDVEKTPFPVPVAPVMVEAGDARFPWDGITPVDAVITSPPYLNRNNYIAQQKAELSLLRLVEDYDAYRALVRSTFSSHVESGHADRANSKIPEVNTILDAFELSQNNNAKIPHMIAGYFDDLQSTLEALHNMVRPQGKLAFVVGNSRWGGVVVPVDHLLALIAERVGFRVVRILVTRQKGNSPQQMKRYGRIPVRESIVILQREG